MSDPIDLSQAAAQSAANIPGASADSLVSSQQGQQQEQVQGQQPATLTREDVAAIARQVAADVATPIAQKFAGKAEGRVQGEIRRRFAELDSLQPSLKLSDADKQRVQNDIVREVLTGNGQADDQQPGQQQQAQQQQTQQQSADEFEALPMEIQSSILMMQRAGVTVDENTPEFAKFVKPILDSGNFAQLEENTALAIAAVRQRLQTNKQSADLRTPTGVGGGEANRKPLTADEKISAGLSGDWSSDNRPQK